jgi:hypothetical protein
VKGSKKMVCLNICTKLKAIRFKHLNFIWFIILFSIVIVQNVEAQEIIWHKIFDSDNDDNSKDVATDSESNIIVIGDISPVNTQGYEIRGSIIIKYNAAGDTLWTKKLLNNTPNHLVAVHIDYYDNIYTIGEFREAGEDYIRIIKYTSDGIINSVVTISDTTLGLALMSAAIDSDKNIIIGCNIRGFFGDYFTSKYDSSGNIIWRRQYNWKWEDELQDVTVDKWDNVIVTGYSDNNINWDWCTIKYSPDGDTLWVRRHDVAITDWAYGVTTDREGNVIVVGDSHIQYPGSGGSTAMIVKYSAEGDTLWSKIFQDTLQYEELGAFYDVTTDSVGNIYLTGDFGTWDTLSRYDGNFYVAKCKPSGDTLWSVQYNPGRRDITSGMTLDNTNNIIITGNQQRQQHEYDYVTLKISNNATNIWKNKVLYPKMFTLKQNFPNPFNSTTTIKYQLQKSDHINLSVYNILGQKVRTLMDKKQRAGKHSITFDAFNLASGVYYYRLTIGAESLTKKFLLIR